MTSDAEQTKKTVETVRIEQRNSCLNVFIRIVNEGGVACVMWFMRACVRA